VDHIRLATTESSAIKNRCKETILCVELPVWHQLLSSCVVWLSNKRVCPVERKWQSPEFLELGVNNCGHNSKFGVATAVAYTKKADAITNCFEKLRDRVTGSYIFV